ncbi:MAG: HAD family phosphatase [Dehalococcoidia bacterium]|nr:HAD family phosphatase [Dehalococcoidia bacterium]
MGESIRAVIFDFGGVIVPGSPSGDGADSPFALLERDHGLPTGLLWQALYMENEGWLRLRVGEGSEAEWQACAHARVAAVVDAETAARVLTSFAANRTPGAAVGPPTFNPGMLDLLARLRGRVRLQLLSNAAPGLEADLRAHYRVDHLFDDVVNSATVHLAKPDPRVYRLAARRLGLPPAACFFTDDLLANIEAARAEGMTAHHFVTGCAGLQDALRAAGVAWE